MKHARAVLVALVATAVTLGTPVAPAVAAKPPQGIAHRGDVRFDEETADALRSSIRKGLCNEVDIHLTADNVPVLNHDTTVNRTLSGTGRVRDHTVASFLRMTTESGRHPITLRRAILITRRSSGCMVVEVWPGYWNPSRYAALGRMVRPKDHIWFDSYRKRVLAQMHRAAPRLKLAWKPQNATYRPRPLPSYITVVLANDSTRAMVRAHHRAGIKVFRYAVRRNRVDAVAAQGVDKIFTNSVRWYANHFQ
jgi:glycerophosphoryl diester phosphodiesterase